MQTSEDQRNAITWLHLSDLHFCESKSDDTNKVIKSLLGDIEDRIRSDKLEPDFIIISGDIAFSSLPAEYEIAGKFVTKLLEITNITKERLFLVPGNHDINRKINPTIISGLKAILRDRNSVNSLQSDSVECEPIFKRFENYRKFIREYMAEDCNQFDENKYFYVKKFKIADKNIAILGLNTAWISTQQEEQGQLLLGERQISNAIEISGSSDLLLAVMHHPSEWLRYFDRNDAEGLLLKSCDFILQGHMHRFGISLNTTPDGEAYVISAGACYETREYPNSYNFARIDLDTLKCSMYLRTYSDERGGFWTKDVRSYRNVDNGIYVFPLSKHLSEMLGNEKELTRQMTVHNSRIGLYYGNSYVLKENFTGRVQERKLLSDWLGKDGCHILSLIAMGGMGKSALIWTWLHSDILDQTLPGMLPDTEEERKECRIQEDSLPSSIFWWSFYDQEASFDKFLEWLSIQITKETKMSNIYPSKYDKIKAIINKLRDNRFLLILDGFERELRAYSTLNAAYQEEPVVDGGDKGFNRCTDINADTFLRSLAAFPLKSKILLTSRLLPFELNEIASCKSMNLIGMKSDDAVRFYHSIGIKGTRAEIELACEPYEYHPLALRVLAGLIIYHPTDPMNITAASSLDPIPELKQRENHILDLAYNQLTVEKRNLLSRMAASRSPIDYKIVKLLSPFQTDIDLRNALMELEKRNIILYDRRHARYDLHQVVREYAYRKLGNKIEIHAKLKDYFSSIKYPTTASKLDDLSDVIELYHHTINSGLPDEALKIYRKHIDSHLYDHLGAFQVCIKLLRALFLDGEDLPPKLQDKDDQGYVLNSLAICYGHTGQSKYAESVLEIAIPLAKKKINEVIGRMNLSSEQLNLGKLSEAGKNCRISIEKAKEDNDALNEAKARLHMSEILSYLGDFTNASKELVLVEKLNKILIKESNFIITPDSIFLRRANNLLLANRPGLAERAARKAMRLADSKALYEWTRIELRLAICKATLSNLPDEKTRRDKLLEDVEVNLSRATTSCRSINWVEKEPDILLIWSKLYFTKDNFIQARHYANEALYIANRCDYVLKKAEIYNFMAIMDIRDGNSEDAIEHANNALIASRYGGPSGCYKPAMQSATELLSQTIANVSPQ